MRFFVAGVKIAHKSRLTFNEFLVRGETYAEAREMAQEWALQMYSFGIRLLRKEAQAIVFNEMDIEFTGLCEIPPTEYLRLSLYIPCVEV
jgi:hypothetical protein